MKIRYLLIALGLPAFTSMAFAAETLGEKAEAKTNDIKRDASQSIHRVEEAVCMESDVKCLAEKAKNRVEETTQTIKDKSGEIKNSVDEEPTQRANP